MLRIYDTNNELIFEMQWNKEFKNSQVKMGMAAY